MVSRTTRKKKKKVEVRVCIYIHGHKNCLGRERMQRNTRRMQQRLGIVYREKEKKKRRMMKREKETRTVVIFRLIFYVCPVTVGPSVLVESTRPLFHPQYKTSSLHPFFFLFIFKLFFFFFSIQLCTCPLATGYFFFPFSLLIFLTLVCIQSVFHSVFSFNDAKKRKKKVEIYAEEKDERKKNPPYILQIFFFTSFGDKSTLLIHLYAIQLQNL